MKSKYMVQVSDKGSPYVRVIERTKSYIVHQHLDTGLSATAGIAMFRPCTKAELLEIAVKYDY